MKVGGFKEGLQYNFYLSKEKIGKGKQNLHICTQGRK